VTPSGKISIVIPTFNRGYILARALRSVCEQTYTQYEIVVVDDGSTDDTQDVVAAVTQTEVRYLRHPRNLGVAAAANTGVRAATGDFLAFMGSDDVLKPYMFESLMEVFSKYPDLDTTFGDVEIVEGSEGQPWTQGLARQMPRFSQLLPRDRLADPLIVTRRDMYLCLLEEVPVKPTAMIVRKRAFDQIGAFSENLKSGEDWEWFLRLVRVTDFGYVDRAVVRQYHLPDALHRVMREADKLGVIELLSREERAAAGDTEAQAAARRGIVNAVQELGFHYRANRRYGRAFVTYARGFVQTHAWKLALRACFAWVPLEIQARVRSR
jgi:glycosyltransferase involved in cell wall biosynthesis